MIKASTVLTCLSAVGVIATAVLAAKETPKAAKLLRDAWEEKGEELTAVEVIKTAAPAYAPAIAVGVTTIACMFGANILNTRQQAALTSAYALLDNSYREYRRKVDDIYGENADDDVKEAIAKDQYEGCNLEPEEDEQLFMDFNTLRYFRAKYSDVVQKFTTDDGLECYIISTPYMGNADYLNYESRY